jgi:hypothetical protein
VGPAVSTTTGSELFGIPVALEDVALPVPDAGPPAPDATHVRRAVGEELDVRWGAAAPQRARELRDPAGELLLSVDADPAAGYLVAVPAMGRFLVSPDGREVLCAPRPGAAWSDLLTGQLLPLAATLRGLEVLHASAVALDGRALAVTAPPGYGKTSIALHLVLAGAPLLTDDAVALDPSAPRLTAYPGLGTLGVRPQEDALLEPGERARLGEAEVAEGRLRYRVPRAAGPLPLGGLCVLRRLGAPDARMAVRVLDPVDPFTLLASTFNLSVRTPERLRRQLDLCGRLAAEVPVVALDAPAGVGARELAAAVLAWDGLR